MYDSARAGGGEAGGGEAGRGGAQMACQQRGRLGGVRMQAGCNMPCLMVRYMFASAPVGRLRRCIQALSPS